MLILRYQAVSASAHIGRIELAHGKRHIIEYSAGVILVCHDTFLVGHCVLGCVYKVLRGTNDTNDREYTYRNHELSFGLLAVAEASVKSERDAFGYIVAATAATAAVSLAFLRSEEHTSELQSR